MEPRSPYPGPRSFEREDEPIFFGRDSEANQLALLVVAHKEVLLYAPSGAGKTSLINAKLSRLLEEREGFEIVGPARVQGALPEVSTPNIFVFHTLMSLTRDGVEPERLATMTIPNFLQQRTLEDKERSSNPRLLIFDQFEELFTYHPDRWREHQGFFEQVRDALNDDPMLRSLFVMRADYIGRLQRYAPVLPQKFRTHFYLEHLRRDAALVAVARPAERFGRRFAPKAAAGQGTVRSLAFN